MAKQTYHWHQLCEDLSRDIDAYLRFSAEYNDGPSGWKSRLSALVTPSVFCCLLYRLSHFFHSHAWPRVGLAIAMLNLLLNKTSICPASSIGGGLYIAHPGSTVIFQGNAGTDLKMFAAAAVTSFPPLPLHAGEISNAPRLGDDISLGAKSHIFGDITIGGGVRVAFNAAVSTSIPNGATVLSKHIRNRHQNLP